MIDSKLLWSVVAVIYERVPRKNPRLRFRESLKINDNKNIILFNIDNHHLQTTLHALKQHNQMASVRLRSMVMLLSFLVMASTVPSGLKQIL